MSFKDFIEGIKAGGEIDKEVSKACDDLVDKFYPLQCKCGCKFPAKAKYCVECGEKLQ